MKLKLILIFLLLIPLISAENIENDIPVKGRLTSANGIPLSGTRTFVFTIYNSLNGDSSLYTTTSNISNIYFASFRSSGYGCTIRCDKGSCFMH